MTDFEALLDEIEAHYRKVTGWIGPVVFVMRHTQAREEILADSGKKVQWQGDAPLDQVLCIGEG